MSNKKDSSVIAATVVKAGDEVKEAAKTSDNKAQATEAHFDSIAELKSEVLNEQSETNDKAAGKATNAKKAQDNKAAEKKTEDKKTTETKAPAAKATESKATDSTATAAKPETAKPAAKATTATKAEAKKEEAKNATPKPATPEKPTTKEEDTMKDDAKKDATKDTATKVQAAPKSASRNGQVPVAILGGNRIPFARSNGPYANASNIDMLSAALNGLVERFDLQGKRVGEVVAGAVLKLSRDLNLTREAALNTALDPHTPAYDISQACGTGLQATFAAANKISLGIIDSAITGGVDTTSDAPIAVGDGLRKALIQLGAAKTNKDRLKALLNINPKELIDAPQNGEPRTGLSMGDHQAITTLEWNISREDQDDLAFNSHKNLARAYDEGFFDDLITPYKGLTRDNNLRPDTKKEKLATLKPVFGKKNANPTMTAANSTPLTDGASCVLLANDEWAAANGFKPLAYLVHQETAAVDFIGKSGEKEGLLMAPAYAVPRMLERAGLTLQDFDFYEIHEAFASQVLSTLAAWEDETFCKERLGLDAPLGSIDRSKLNVNGSSLAAGHPFAATGGRILASAAKMLDQKGSGRALISICAAGGQGVTCILEK
ncbi:acetyl-CoA C-acetyltransferase [Psychrobacter arenosus]|uniref:acetyl-CoA C-acetyltransferase n=1 Tax=Psychrobacter arenosus TaxID=256326 RepID=UPI001D0F4F9C|nr:acetyl-CoA C-acetyltransferase [Psychrobacter arenosus]